MFYYLIKNTATLTISLILCSQIVVAESKLSYPQIATGQVKNYNNQGIEITTPSENESYYGQDACYSLGAKMSYTDNGDGTITDNNTGLMWQKVPVPQGFSWENARVYCENLELGGFDDWRMPSCKELFSISNFSTGWPYLDTKYFSLATGRVQKTEQFWTSNKYLGKTGEGGYNAAFGVNHATGHIKAYPASGGQRGGEGGRGEMQGGPQGDGIQGQSGQQGGPPSGGRQSGQGMQRSGRQSGQQGGPPSDGRQSGQQGGPPSDGRQSGQGMQRSGPGTKYVRAVRGKAYGINEFKDNEDGTISDLATGLMWSKNDSMKGMDWEAALKFAENSTLANYDDWRLPNVKELQGIVDYSYAPDAQDSSKDRAAIDPIFNCSTITNEANAIDYPYFWSSTSALFTRNKPYYYAWYVAFGRAVNGQGADGHGAGAVRFDTKYQGGPAGEDRERVFNYVRLVRNIESK